MHKNLVRSLAVVLLATPGVFAQGIDAGTETAIRGFLGRCSGELKISRMDAGLSPAAGFTFTPVKVEGGGYSCDGPYVVARSRSGSAWVGNPWPLTQDKRSAAERIREFGWQRLQQVFEVTVAEQMTPDGLFPVTLKQVTESGPVELRGSVDHAGRYFFLGEFRPINAKFATARYDSLAATIADSPAKGPQAAKVTLVEFSDFQCPACAHAQPHVEELVEKYGQDLRYVRADLPLVSAHPWAFAAAVYGRAIARQNVDAFWEFKKQVYENQSSLNLFALESFANGFASEAGLDMERFQADLNDPALGEAVRSSMGAAFTAQIVGTPTFFVNGQLVAFGHDGDTLEAAIREAAAHQ